MLELSEGRWTEIRQIAYQDELEPVSLRVALKEVLLHYQHLEKQIKLLADYIMSERPDDPAWKLCHVSDKHSMKVLGGACAMAVEIMKRESKDIKEMNETMKWLGEGYDD